MHEVVIVGAGPAGIATALSLVDRGVNALLVDRGDRVGWSWHNRYDRLRLNTGRQFSHLPGRPYPKGTPTYPTRDQVVAHFERHVRDAGIALRLGTEVQRIDRHGGAWRLTTSTGDIDGVQVVVPEPRAPSGQTNPGRGRGLVGPGDRARSRDGWAGQGVAVDPHTAEPRAAAGPGERASGT